MKHRGEIQLIKKGNGYFYLYFDRRHEKSLRTKDPILANQLYEEALAAKRGRNVAILEKVSRIRLSEFRTDYLKARNLQDVCVDTVVNDSLAIRRFIDCEGDLLCRLVTVKSIDHFKTAMLDAGKSKSYINILLRSLRAAFNYAIEEKIIDSNPFMKKAGKKPVLFKIDDELPRFLSLSEIERILGVIDDPDFLVALNTYLYTGVRRSELMRLDIADIDFAHGFIYVRKTKGKKDRAVPIHEDLFPILEKHVKGKGDIGPLFPRWRSADTYSSLFHEYAEKAAVKARLHDMRHTFGSYLALSGVDIRRIKDLMGHSSIDTTLKYARLMKEDLQPAVNKLNYRR
ncbi:MAG: tyrosine-type recombinase/integrase [Dissulfurispiraceae bacterium]